jgi:hypothetical protein
MNVIAAGITAQGDQTMKHFTIDTDNNITVHASKKAARETGAGVFSTEEQLADLIGSDNKRLVEIWNSLAGVTPVTKFANRKVAAERIWKAIQGLGEIAGAPAPAEQAAGSTTTTPEPMPAIEVAAETTSEPAGEQEAAAAENDTLLPAEVSEPAQLALEVQETATAAEPATFNAQVPDVAPWDAQGKKGSPAKKAPKAKKAAKPANEESGPGSRDAAARGRRHPLRNHDHHGLAEAYRTRLHGWRDEEGGVHRRILQAGERRAHLPDQQVGLSALLLPARLRPRRAFLLYPPFLAHWGGVES